ncbi:MAG: hypothetical protein OK455_10125 [Thaumarchaeota archaeon]|nr:hypothetical protein [Nitrososphaerota archaeon]
MGLGRKFTGGLILVIILLSLATSFATYLAVTHQSCSSTTTSLGTSGEVFGSTNSSTSSGATLAPKAISPLPIVSADLILTPLDNLSFTQRNSTASSDLTDPAFWGQVSSSEFQTYKEVVPQTVLGFYNSSEEWRSWVLQYIPSSSSWLATGFIADAQGQVSVIDPTSNGSNNESATAVESGINDFAASAAGVTLASLDFISFNGLTGLKTLFQTNDPFLAVCQTLPGQLAQLYESSFDPSVPQSERAQYLGRALAITSVMILVGGKDRFADQFQTALSGVGLRDAWPAVKPYLGDIASKVSAAASSTAFGILQTLAGRFPSDSGFVTGFTADRIDSMVDVLEKKGVSEGQIQGDLHQIAQAAGTSAGEEDTGDAADILSLQQGGSIGATVQSDRTLVRYEDASGRSVSLNGYFLQQAIPGFDARGPEFVQIHYQEAGTTVYHYYPVKSIPVGAPYSETSTNWYPTVPGDVARPGDKITISFDILTTDDFINSIPPIAYLNTAGASWVADFSEVTSFKIVGSQIDMNVEQQTLEGVSSFQVGGTPGELANVGGDTFLEFKVPDAVNPSETLKITFNGNNQPVLSFESGSNFNPVTLVSSDGVKLKFVYDSGGDSVAVATVYLKQPSILWQLPAMQQGDFGFPVSGASQTFTLSNVLPSRGLEKEMVNSGDKYDLARVGAEIAYTVSQQEFGVENVQLNEPSQGGADLASGDGTVTIQARMLGAPSALSPANLQTTLSHEINDLAGKVQTDFKENSSARTGYAILSYLDPTTKTIVTLIAVIQKTG